MWCQKHNTDVKCNITGTVTAGNEQQCQNTHRCSMSRPTETLHQVSNQPCKTEKTMKNIQNQPKYSVFQPKKQKIGGKRRLPRGQAHQQHRYGGASGGVGPKSGQTAHGAVQQYPIRTHSLLCPPPCTHWVWLLIRNCASTTPVCVTGGYPTSS